MSTALSYCRRTFFSIVCLAFLLFQPERAFSQLRRPDAPAIPAHEQPQPTPRTSQSSNVLVLSDPGGGKDASVHNYGGDLLLGSITSSSITVAGGRQVDTSSYNDHMILTLDGNVGIGSRKKPAHRLGIDGGPTWTTNGWKGSLELDNASAIAWKGNDAGLRFGIGHTNGGLYFFHTTSELATTGAPALYDLEIKDDGTVAMKAMELMGADIAENFEVRSDDNVLKQGLVVSIDARHEGKLVISNQAYDHRVAGVISGAGGITPGVVMGRGSSMPDIAYPVALTGRVYCWVDASSGPVRPGDLLTTSTRPGHAMKVTNYMKAQGAIIGKAMGELENGTGLVLVLVSLQ